MMSCTGCCKEKDEGMFRKTSAQTSLLENQFLLPKVKRARLERSWARGFRDRVLPLIDEELFRASFHKSQGRPNKSIRLLVGLHLIKEMRDYTDTEVIDAFEFNLQVQYALGEEARTAHVCQKTLHNHRKLLMEEERAQAMFERITKGLAEVDGLSLGRQRLDSTHVMSNMAVLTRLGLFVETITSFLAALRRELPAKLEQLEARYVKRYLEREGYFSDAKRGEARRRLRAVASDLYRLLTAFGQDEEVLVLASYRTLARLFEEQCELVESASAGSQAIAVPKPDAREQAGADDDEEAGLGADDAPIGAETTALAPPRPSAGARPEDEEQVRLRQGQEIATSSLQSPHDPDATYGRKGKGYEAQIAETCGAENPYQLITGVALNGANESDQGAVLGMVDQLDKAGLGPRELTADTAYGSGENIVACAERGVDLQAPVQDPDAPSKKDRMSEPVQPTVLCEGDDEGASDAAVVAPPSSPEQYEALGLEDFEYNETYGEVLRCPAGQVPIEQITDKKGKTVWTRFSAESCASCPFAAGCPTHRREDGVRTFRWRRAKAATACRQREQQGADFKERYKIRSGIEATNAELKGRHGARRLRVRGQKRVDLAMRMKALAVNAKRASEHRAACLRASDGQAEEVEQPLEASRTEAVTDLGAATPVVQAEHREPAPPRAEADAHVTAVQVSTSPLGLVSDAHVTPPPASTSPPQQVIERGTPPAPPNTATHPRPPGMLRALGRRLTRAFEQRAKQVDMLLAPLLQGVSTGT